MKSEYKECDGEISFPCLMRSVSDEIIVLFTNSNKGTVVYTNIAKYPLGYYSNGWENCALSAMWVKVEKDASITLKNS